VQDHVAKSDSVQITDSGPDSKNSDKFRNFIWQADTIFKVYDDSVI
jgi:hypothetical protein